MGDGKMGSYSVDEQMDVEEVCPRCHETMYPICNVVVIDQNPEDNYVRCSACRRIIRSQWGTTYEWDGVEERKERWISFFLAIVVLLLIFNYSDIREALETAYAHWRGYLPW